MATEIVLIRHGHAVRIRGDYVYAPITDLGRQQAEQTGAFFLRSGEHLDALYTSPLRRTRETATIIGAIIKLNPVQLDAVQELKVWETPLLVLLEFFSIIDPVEDYLDDHAGKLINWPIVGRTSAVALSLVKKYQDARVGVVTHAGVISSLLSWIKPQNRWHYWTTTVGNCSLTHFRFNASAVQLLEVNNSDHLRQVETAQPPTPAVEVVQKVHPTSKPL